MLAPSLSPPFCLGMGIDKNVFFPHFSSVSTRHPTRLKLCQTRTGNSAVTPKEAYEVAVMCVNRFILTWLNATPVSEDNTMYNHAIHSTPPTPTLNDIEPPPPLSM